MNDFKISARGLELIKEFEGCRLNAYRCPANVWTIGYGHTKGVTENTSITQEQADEMLKSDVDNIYGPEVNKLFNDANTQLTQNEFDALTSFAFNVGIKNLASSSVYKHLVKGNKKEAAQCFLLWNKVGATVLTGLTRRRQAESDLFLS